MANGRARMWEQLDQAAAGAVAVRSFARMALTPGVRMFHANPSHPIVRMISQEESNSHQRKPCLALVGKA